MSLQSRNVLLTVLLDFIALAFVFFVPALSHITGVPLYLAEPMRVMVILALLHSHKFNAWALALILPTFSFFASGHPYPVKMAIMTAELLVNVALFRLLVTRTSPFASMLIAIVASKVFYYVLKYVFVSAGLLRMDLFSTPVLIQVVTTLVFSLYAFLVLKKNISKNDPISFN